ncbi:MAG: hypothetical protein KIT16_07010 [Rhodospirillaceae bacterium]|nr:hypothetical protein [Rhodospirillaceae bacterium]
MFVVNKSYTRDEIHDVLGGSKQSFLPTVGGRVVCACLTRKLNPNVPAEILVGNGPKILRSAKILSAQSGKIPVFIKERSNFWVFVGEFSVDHSTDNRRDIEPLQAKAGRTDVRLIVFLKR